ncbi:MAG: hypothetical protein ACOC29_03275 [Candidatus Sumerlaeota bacterium]
MWIDGEYKDLLMRDALDGELDGERLRDFGRLVAEDVDFAEEYVELRRLGEEVAELGLLDSEKRVDLVEDVMRDIRFAPAPARPRQSVATGRFLAAAAALALAVLGPLLYWWPSDLAGFSGTVELFDDLTTSGEALWAEWSSAMSGATLSLQGGVVFALTAAILAAVAGVNAWSARANAETRKGQ